MTIWKHAGPKVMLTIVFPFDTNITVGNQNGHCFASPLHHHPIDPERFSGPAHDYTENVLTLLLPFCT